MISYPVIYPNAFAPPCGDAVHLIYMFPIDEPADLPGGEDRAVSVRIMRKVGSITGIEDAGAEVLYEGRPTGLWRKEGPLHSANVVGIEQYSTFIFRDYSPTNGVTYEYGFFVMDTETYVSGTTVYSTIATISATPNLLFDYSETEWQTLLDERLLKGYTNLVQSGRLVTTKNRKTGARRVPQVTPQFLTQDELPLPIAITHLEDDSQDETFVADQGIGGQRVPASDGSLEFESERARFFRQTYSIEIWSHHRQERDRLAQATKAILMMNLEVFNLAGAHGYDFHSRQFEALENKGGEDHVLYGQSITFSFSAPLHLELLTSPVIGDIEIEVTPFENPQEPSWSTTSK